MDWSTWVKILMTNIDSMIRNSFTHSHMIQWKPGIWLSEIRVVYSQTAALLI